MKIIHISDTHNKHKQIKWNFDPANADMIICTGDFSGYGQKHEVESFLKWFQKLPIQYKVLVAGNHDRSFDPERAKETGGDGIDKPEWLKEYLAEYTKYDALHFYLENSSCEIEGIKIWGSPCTPDFNPARWAFNKSRGEVIEQIWQTIPKDTDIIATHGPVMYKLDYVEWDKEFTGCENLLNHVKRIKPLLFLCGHIHEGYGVTYDQDTTYSNAAICDLGYLPVNIPNVFEVNLSDRKVDILQAGKMDI